MLEASGVVSHVTGDPAAILALQTNAVHYYQRPDATHLGVDPSATSLSGHGGSVRFGRSDTSRLRLTDHFHWYSPGLELNDVGYLRQADVIANQVFLGWSETTPRGIFRSYSVQLAREDQWDFGGLQTRSATGLEASGQFKNKWGAEASLAYQDVVDTRVLRGGPALRWHDYYEAPPERGSDPSRRVSASPRTAARLGARRRLAGAGARARRLSLRPSNRLSLSGSVSYEQLLDNLQYVATADARRRHRAGCSGRIDQDTWSFTFRVNLSITPDLTVQYYGSPFIGTGRYTAFKQATDTLAQDNADRFHLYGPDEIAYSAGRQRLPGHGGRRRAVLLLRQPRLQLPAVPLEPRRAVGVEARLVALRRLVAGPHGLRPGVGRLVRLELGRALAARARQRLPRQAQLLVLALTVWGVLRRTPRPRSLRRVNRLRSQPVASCRPGAASHPPGPPRRFAGVNPAARSPLPVAGLRRLPAAVQCGLPAVCCPRAPFAVLSARQAVLAARDRRAKALRRRTSRSP